ncbi:MAG: hypothetical protein QW683_08630 [Candidatus Caldarchaeum sp.]
MATVDEKLKTAKSILREVLRELQRVEAEAGIVDPWEEPDEIRLPYLRLLSRIDAVEDALAALNR